MLCVGENLNIMQKTMAQAFKERNAHLIQKMALAQQQAGMHYIDVNIGPAKKNGPALMTWLVETIQQAVDLPLSLDTSNIEAMEAGLAAHKGRALINSIMARPERYNAMLPLANKYDANMVALLWGPEGLPRDENERAAWAVDLIYAANESGISNERIFVDPIITPLNIQQPQLLSTLTFMQMLPELAENARSICGLSNLSNGAAWRAPLNQTYAAMLKQVNMYACIIDYQDQTLIDIAAGLRPDIEQIIEQVQRGVITSPDQAPEELRLYVRAAKVILGHTIYSDSWMEL
jgi:5-methyltetrahydrofolate corrinoid/iron sulfur protein methyltransferase